MTRLPETPTRARPARHEEDAQRLVIRRCDALAARYPALRWLHHSPNGGVRDKRTAALMRAQGARAGFPDLILPVSMMMAQEGEELPGDYFTGYVAELKIAPNRATPEQRAWIAHFEAQGWYVRLHSAPDARTLADAVCLDLWSYLSIPARAYAPLLMD